MESIRLVAHRAFQRLPLSSSSENASILPIEKSPGPSMNDSGFDPKMVPLVKSKLRSVVFNVPADVKLRPVQGLDLLHPQSDIPESRQDSRC